MSHRNDLFAAEALQGLLAAKAAGSSVTLVSDEKINWYCIIALKYADKMEELRPIVEPAGSGAVTTETQPGN